MKVRHTHAGDALQQVHEGLCSSRHGTRLVTLACLLHCKVMVVRSDLTGGHRDLGHLFEDTVAIIISLVNLTSDS